jgi:parvulin-like peptidyl-prolyl isomerase
MKFHWQAICRADGWGNTVKALGILGLLAVAYCWGRLDALPRANAVPPGTAAKSEPAGVTSSGPSEYSERWVAVIHGNIPVTREEFGEYLIVRHADKLELLVNKRIIERACKAKNIDVTAAEVEAALAEDLKGLNVTLKDFVDKVLKNYHKSLFEWKEDVIRPRLALNKLCRSEVQVTEKDLQDAFEAFHGEKVECRLILFPPDQKKEALQKYPEIRKSEEDFIRFAKQQASASLATKGGLIAPIGRHTTGDENLEKEAFRLQPGEISSLIETPQGQAVLWCIKRVPADKTKTVESERASLEKVVLDKKTQVEMQNYFKQLQAQAQPKLFLNKSVTQEEVESTVKKDLQDAPKSKPPMK